MTQVLPPQARCGRCKTDDAILGVYPMATRPPLVGLWCPSCKAWVTRDTGFPGVWIPLQHPLLKYVVVADLPSPAAPKLMPDLWGGV